MSSPSKAGARTKAGRSTGADRKQPPSTRPSSKRGSSGKGGGAAPKRAKGARKPAAGEGTKPAAVKRSQSAARSKAKAAPPKRAKQPSAARATRRAVPQRAASKAAPKQSARPKSPAQAQRPKAPTSSKQPAQAARAAKSTNAPKAAKGAVATRDDAKAAARKAVAKAPPAGTVARQGSAKTKMPAARAAGSAVRPGTAAGKRARGAQPGPGGRARSSSGPATAPARVAPPRVEIAPRRHVSVTPSLPLPVQAPVKRPTLQQRARRIETRLNEQDADFQKRYRDNFDMSWVYHDAALEGVVYTFAELTSALAANSVPPTDSTLAPIYESIVRQKATIDFVRDLATKKRTPLSVDIVRSIYVLLHPEEGDIKAVKYRRDIPQHRLYFHEYAPPDKITYRMRQIVDWLNDSETRRKVGVLRMAAKAHYDIARTYPFPSDSGKVARLFMNVLLMRGGLPPAIFHAAERQRYYEALKTATPSALFHMLRDSVENSMASIEKLLDEHETHKRSFIN